MRNIYFGLDLGHYEIKLSAIEETFDNRFISYNHYIKNEYLRKNDILDINALLFSLDLLISNILDALSINKINKLGFCLDLYNFQEHIQKGHTIFERNINEDDIEKAIKTAETFLILNQQEILLKEPIKFVIDGTQEIRNPLGFSGRKLDAEVLFISCHRSIINKLRSIFRDLNIEIIGPYPSIYTASKVCLSKRDKEIGVILMDIGGEVTSVGIFNEGKMFAFKTFNFGSDFITQDLSVYLKIDIEDAENLKREILKEEKETTIKKLNKKKVLKFIEKKLKEYFEENKIIQYFKDIKKNFKLPAGMILIGGLSNMVNIEYFLKNLLDIQVRKPKDELGIFETTEEALKFSSSAGAALMVKDKKEKYGLFGKIKKFISIFFGK